MRFRTRPFPHSPLAFPSDTRSSPTRHFLTRYPLHHLSLYSLLIKFKLVYLSLFPLHSPLPYTRRATTVSPHSALLYTRHSLLPLALAPPCTRHSPRSPLPPPLTDPKVTFVQHKQVRVAHGAHICRAAVAVLAARNVQNAQFPKHCALGECGEHFGTVVGNHLCCGAKMKRICIL